MDLLAFLQREGEASLSDDEVVVTMLTVPYLKAGEHYRSCVEGKSGKKPSLGRGVGHLS